MLQALLTKVEHRRGKKTVWLRALTEQAQHASLEGGGAQARSPVDAAHPPRTAATAIPTSSAAARGHSGPLSSAGCGAPERNQPAAAVRGSSNPAAAALSARGVTAAGAPHSSAAPAGHRAGDVARHQPAAQPPVGRAAGSGDHASGAGGGASAVGAGACRLPAPPHLRA